MLHPYDPPLSNEERVESMHKDVDDLADLTSKEEPRHISAE